MTAPAPTAFADKTRQWPDAARARFDDIRRIVLSTCDHVPDLRIVETLKWGQPAWLPDRPGIGSTLRAAWSGKRPNDLSLFVHCQTTLAEQVRSLYPDSFAYDGNRALHLPLDAPLPEQAIAHCAHLTLTYHRKTA